MHLRRPSIRKLNLVRRVWADKKLERVQHSTRGTESQGARKSSRSRRGKPDSCPCFFPTDVRHGQKREDGWDIHPPFQSIRSSQFQILFSDTLQVRLMALSALPPNIMSSRASSRTFRRCRIQRRINRTHRIQVDRHQPPTASLQIR